MDIIVGGLLEKDGKYLLVQESNPKCYKKWNLPAGHLELDETLQESAIREIKEETGCDVEITGISYISKFEIESNIILIIIFNTKIINSNVIIDGKEILNAKWFSIEEIKNEIYEDLRHTYICKVIHNYENKVSASIDIIDDNI